MKERIEYIDALRGFTMLLVVYSHVRLYGFHVDDSNIVSSFNSIFILIRMPLFFFVSGYLFYKAERNKDNTFEFILKKMKVQVFSTLIFMSIYSYIFNYNLTEGLFNYHKSGYWFTLTLFSFFVAYFILNFIFSKIKITNRFKDVIWISTALILHFVTTNKCMQLLGLYGNISNLLGIIMFKYYIFFILGTLTKKYFQTFLKITESNLLLTTLIILFFIPLIPALKYNPASTNVWIKHLIFIYFGIIGTYLVFIYFNKYQNYFTKTNSIGKIFQFIGRRTLDIYLLHYFFLPRKLEWLSYYFLNFQNPCIELFVSLFISMIVISICLLTSSIIRMSPFLSYNLFGSIRK